MAKAKKSAGILLYRQGAAGIEVLLVHPGGPFWAKKDAHAWSIPKGELADPEDPLECARREFTEETGGTVAGAPVPLQPLRQPSGKTVYAWAVQGDFDPTQLRSNTFTMEWPPRSGTAATFPEVDRAGWFTLDQAQTKILKSQRPLLDQLCRLMGDEV